MNTWFTADSHFGHSNIIKYCLRPFKNIGEHDTYLINRWNSRVKQEDVVFHLGDFCFKALQGRDAQYYLNQLNGKIIILKGNHDTQNGVKTCIRSMRLELGGKDLQLVHAPEDVDSLDIDLALCGHIHNYWKFKSIPIYQGKKVIHATKYCNVGVDVWDYMPVTINEILRELGQWERKGRNESCQLRESGEES